MDLTLNEEQQMLKNTAREFLEAECNTRLVRDLEEDERGYSTEMWTKMAQLGWCGVPFPEEYGGEGGDIANMMVIYEEMGRAIPPIPHLASVILGGLTVLYAGNEEQKKRVIPPVAHGETILCLAQLEPNGVWDADGVEVTATADGNDYLINGTKVMVQYAHVADLIVCVARTSDSGTPENGITLFLVDTRSPGITVTPMETMALDKQNGVVFENVRVSRDNVLGEVNQGWAPLTKALQYAGVMQNAAIIGTGEKVQEMSTDYAKERVQYGRPIGVNQAIQWKCVDMAKYMVSVRILNYAAVARISDEDPAEREVAAANAHASEAARFCAYESHQIFAGFGYMMEHDLQLYTRRLKAAEYNLGDAEYHLEKLALAIGM
jgi:alkylation response protein AidB-like acyl-CoA dehydrogenase